MNNDREQLASAMQSLDQIASIIHARNVRAGWWPEDKDSRNVPEMLMLIVSEVAEAMEGHRKGLQDEKLPQYPMIIVELVDALIREFDLLGKLCEDHGLSLAEVMMAKIDFNAVRADHQPENRAKEGGKKY